MFSLAAYSASYAAAQTDTDMPALTDATWSINSNNHIVPQQQLWVRWAYALGLTITRARIKTPRMLAIGRPCIRPIEQAANPSSRPQLAEYWRAPLRLNALEELAIQISNTTAVAERDYVILSLGDTNFTSASGDLYTIRATSTFASVANAWASGSFTLDDTIAVGKYSVQGMENEEATGVAARLIFVGSPSAGVMPSFRPGVISITSLGSQDTRWFRWGSQGEYGRFDSFALPNLEVLNTAAGVVVRDVYLDIVQLSSSAP